MVTRENENIYLLARFANVMISIVNEFQLGASKTFGKLCDQK